MTQRTDKEQMANTTDERTKKSGQMHSGTPNPKDTTEEHTTEHKSGYGGEGGEPRTSPDKGKGAEK